MVNFRFTYFEGGYKIIHSHLEAVSSPSTFHQLAFPTTCESSLFQSLSEINVCFRHVQRRAPRHVIAAALPLKLENQSSSSSPALEFKKEWRQRFRSSLKIERRSPHALDFKRSGARAPASFKKEHRSPCRSFVVFISQIEHLAYFCFGCNCYLLKN